MAFCSIIWAVVGMATGMAVEVDGMATGMATGGVCIQKFTQFRKSPFLSCFLFCCIRQVNKDTIITCDALFQFNFDGDEYVCARGNCFGRSVDGASDDAPLSMGVDDAVEPKIDAMTSSPTADAGLFDFGGCVNGKWWWLNAHFRSGALLLRNHNQTYHRL